MPLKRKAATESPPARSAKATKPSAGSTSLENGVPKYRDSRKAEEYDIVDRRYYPPEITNERCQQYNENQIPRPIEQLTETLKATADARSKIEVGDAVIHWFKRDLRTRDNRGLWLASQKAKSKGAPLICLFLVSPQDYEAHMTSAPRVDFELRTLEVLKADLQELGVPLWVETVEKRRNVPSRILELAEKWGAKHIFCNIEYEVDELRRETRLTQMCLDKGVAFEAVHDDVIVEPGALVTGQGRQFSVYSPWYRAWVAHLHGHPEKLDAYERPGPNPKGSLDDPKMREAFECKIPAAPENKRLGEKERGEFVSMWPAGEHEAKARLDKFVSQKIGKYKEARNFPAVNSTSVLSVHYSAGTLAARSAVRTARDANSTKKLDGGSEGIKGWISEVAWRDFYKHVLAHWPYVCMNKPFKYEYSNIEWEYDEAHFGAWCEGKTGYPFVDAAMRQLKRTGYMHNRARMVVASFLAKDLLLDWRMGERYFMTRLIDGDFASNNGGWGFSASTGVDPQPYFRIFNPLLQSEKFDPDGEYIRRWVEELRGVQGKAVHDPYARGAAKQAQSAGYPRMIVDHKVCRNRTLERYKKGLGRDTA